MSDTGRGEMRYLIDGFKSLLEHKIVSVGMSFEDVQARCKETDIHEYEDINDMRIWWAMAQKEFCRRKT